MRQSIAGNSEHIYSSVDGSCRPVCGSQCTHEARFQQSNSRNFRGKSTPYELKRTGGGGGALDGPTMTTSADCKHEG